MVTRGTVVRRSVWAFATLCLLQTPVLAQDRLILGTHEVTASGADFGATVGPAGALGGALADGGRFGLLYDHLIDRASGRRMRLRGENTFGRGTASNEVVLVIP